MSPQWISKEISDYINKKKVNANKRKGKTSICDQETEIIDLDDPKSIEPLKKKLTVTGIISSSRSALSPLQLKKDEKVPDIIQRRKIEKQPLIVEHVKNEEKKIIDSFVVGWFYSSVIPFNTTTDPEFEVLCKAIRRFGLGYKPPIIWQLRALF